jgi:putative oxidoreductase
MSMPTKIYLDGSTPSVRPSTPAEDTYTGVVQEKERAALKRFVAVDAGEAVIHHWLMRYSLPALRISMGAVVFGFGILKYFPGMSPAQDLVLATTHLLSFGLVPAVVPSGVAMALVATLECAIGVLLLSGRWLRLAVCLLTVWLTGIMSPVVLLPERLFAGPHHMPTLEGQYVLKDAILLAAAMVIATAVRGATLTDRENHSPKKK